MVEMQVASSGLGGPHLPPARGMKLDGGYGCVPASGSITPAPSAPSVIRSAFFCAAERLGEKVAAATRAVAGQDGRDADEEDKTFFPLTARMPFAGSREKHQTEKTSQLEQAPSLTVGGARNTVAKVTFCPNA